MLLRASAGTAWLLLHVVLSIGPLCRLEERLLPLLSNRRHLGVLTFAFAALHGALAIVQFHAAGNQHPIVSVLTTSTTWSSVEDFPFQIMGLLALGILFVMAATSHDFWLRTLTAPVWKALHMGVYLAYAALVVHIAFGALQSEAPAEAGFLLIGVAVIAAFLQRPLAASRFEYGHVQTYRGWLSRSPTRTLYVDDGERLTRYWLVAPGKFGPQAILEPIDEKPVELDGTLITRGHWHMLEVVSGTLRRSRRAADPPPPRATTRVSFRGRGEVIDSKCFLGVMNPGEGAAHRDCAVRCLSGGVPRMFAYRDGQGQLHLALLLTRAAIQPGRSIELAGELLLAGDEEVLVVEPS